MADARNLIILPPKQLQLSNGMLTLLDADWFEMLSAIPWHGMQASHGKWYAVGHGHSRGSGRRRDYMARVIMDAAPNVKVDHRSGDTLDNRRANLRICTQRQNVQNSERRRGASAYKGVHRSSKVLGKWTAQITDKVGQRHTLGTFVTELEAARAYDKAALPYHGEFARLNVLPEAA